MNVNMEIIKYPMKNFDEQEQIFFYEMLPYISEDIITTTKHPDELEIRINPSKANVVMEKVKFLESTIASNNLKGKVQPQVKVIFDQTQVEMLNNESIYETLLEKGYAVEMAQGVFCYSGVFLSVFRYFENKVKDFAYKCFPDIKEYAIPTLFPIDQFSQGGYFETFPHHIMFQTIMKNDIEILDTFSKNGVKDPNIFEHMRQPDYVLRNAACVPIYPMLENQEIDASSLNTYFVSGRCFRNEAANVLQLARLNEFNMSEIVFVGQAEDVRKGIEEARQLWTFWMDTFKLNCEIATANDSFFASNYKKLKLFQLLGDSKEELRLCVPGLNDYIAAASVNFHRTHFTKKYNIKSGDSYCHSSCIAFGLERLTFAFLSQYGLETEKWPEETKLEIGKYTKI